MGGSNTTTQNTTQHTEPWKAATPVLNSIVSGLGKIDTNLTGNETGAINSLVALARAGNPYAPAIDSYATTMLAGGGPDRTGLINDAYKRFGANLEGTAAGDYLDPQRNPWFNTVTSTIGDDVTKRLAGLYAGSGRDPAGAGNFGYNLGRGVAEATAPVFSDVYNRERTNQMNAASALYGAGNTTAGMLSQFDQQRLANEGAGVNAATAATNAAADPYNRMLAAEAQRRAIPVSLLQQLAGITTPMAQAFGTTNGTQTTTTPTNWAQLATGLGIAGIGAMSGNPFAALGGMSSVFGNPGGNGIPATGYYATPQFAINQSNPATWIPAPYVR